MIAYSSNDPSVEKMNDFHQIHNCNCNNPFSTKYWDEDILISPGLKLSRPRGMETFIIPSKSYNDTIAIHNTSDMYLKLSKFPYLKRIEIGDNCFKHIRALLLDELCSLESVKIGEKCFRVGNRLEMDGVFQLTNCPNLRQLEIGNKSFRFFKSFKLSNTNSLQYLIFGDYLFQHTRKLVLDSLPCLESVKIGNQSFTIDGKRYAGDSVYKIGNCPNLRQLEMGNKSFKDFKSFELSNLNSLQSIKFGNWCFHYADFSLRGE